MIDNRLFRIFELLLSYYGPRHWWPAETPFEVCVGAILTQNTNWGNVEKAIANLKTAGRLSVNGIAGLPQDDLATLIRPAGYYNLKAARLQAFTAFLQQQYQGSIDLLFAGPWQQTRTELLTVKGIGPETADSILLYAGQKTSFVVDAYTRRIFSRLGIVSDRICYEKLRNCFMDQLSEDPALFNEYHALIVELGKSVCRPTPQCSSCCLGALCPAAAHTARKKR